MTIRHNVTGPVIVTWNSVQLGYTRDGVNIRIEPRWGEIFSDDFGGAGGAPADKQLLGAIAMVTAELTKYDPAEVQKLTAFEKAGTAGVLPQLGTLMRQEQEFATLLLDGKNDDWSFAMSFPSQSHELNKGTKFTTWVLAFECHINNTSARQLFAIT